MAPVIDWQLVWRHLRRHKQRLWYGQWLAVAGMLCSVPVPLLMPLMVDEVLLHQPGHTIALLDRLLPTSWQLPTVYILLILLATIALRSASVALGVVQGRQFATVAKNLTFNLRRRLLHHLGEVELRQFETRGSGALASRLTQDLDTLDRFVGETISRVVISLLTVIGTAVVLLLIDWRLGLFILLCNPLVILFSQKLAGQVRHLKRDENRAYELFQQALVETFDAVHEIRAANRERHYLARLVDAARGLRDRSIASSWRSEAVGRTSFLIFLIGFELFRAVAMLMVIHADLTIGQIFAVFGYLWFMMTPVNDLLGLQVSYFAASSALTRLNELLELPRDPAPQAAPFSGDQQPPAVVIEQLDFAYSSDQPVLRQLSLAIAPGQQVALVGASGGGKSTLVQLLLGLYRPQAGQIRIGGVALEQWSLASLRERSAVVLQQPTLFNDSLRANLCMGQSFSDEQLWQALWVAALDEHVRTLADGLETLVGNRGVRLSGGQRQRLAIARMVLRQPQLVILDEATSALDTETEQLVHQRLRTFLHGRTCLVIAHRLSAVRHADRIYVFEDGRIVQQGEHQALINQPGLYRTLYAGQ